MCERFIYTHTHTHTHTTDFSIDESGLEESTVHGLDTSSPPPPTSLYQPLLDLRRFQRVVEQEEEEAKRGRLQRDGASQLSSITNAGSERGNATVDSQASSDLRTVRTEAGMTGPVRQDQIRLTPFTHKPPPHPLQFAHRIPSNGAMLPQQCPPLSSTPQNRMRKFAAVKTGGTRCLLCAEMLLSLLFLLKLLFLNITMYFNCVHSAHPY